MQSKDITVIGAAIVDVLAGPVAESSISSGSQPMTTIRMSFGGDADEETSEALYNRCLDAGINFFDTADH